MDKTNVKKTYKSTMQARQDTTYQLSIWRHHLTYIINLIGPTIMEDTKPNVQRYANTQPKNSKLAYILFSDQESEIRSYSMIKKGRLKVKYQ